MLLTPPPAEPRENIFPRKNSQRGQKVAARQGKMPAKADFPAQNGANFVRSRLARLLQSFSQRFGKYKHCQQLCTQLHASSPRRRVTYPTGACFFLRGF
jgi:hypothetical protein